MEKILKWNAEFARNLWMEFTPQRLIMMPVIIGLISMLIISFSSDNSYTGSLHYMSMAGFIIIGMVWGIKNAADSVLDEYNEKTWDWQRMSILGPGKLAMGKLFGSTIYNWYGALICWVIFVVTAATERDPVSEFKMAALLILLAITLHGVMILFSLQNIRKSDGKTKIKSNRIFMMGILIVGVLWKVLTATFADWALEKTGFAWYGIVNNGLTLAIISAAFYCAWVIAGLYRSLRNELQYSDTPTWWLAFLVTSFIFQYGYFAGIPGVAVPTALCMTFALSFAQYLFIVYFLALSEPKDIINFMLLSETWKKRNFKTFFENTPLWLVTLPVAVIAGLLTLLFAEFIPKEGLSEAIKITQLQFPGMRLLLLVAIFGFVIRDLGILLLLNLSSRAKRADSAMMVYLLLLYVVLPLLARKADIIAVFYPDIKAEPWMMILFPLAEAAIVLFFLIRRWKQVSAANKAL